MVLDGGLRLHRLAIFAICCPLLAQIDRPLPNNWAGTGAAYASFARPPVSGWFSYAVLVSEKGALYSFTTHDITSSKTRPYTIQTSVRTGLATLIRRIGPIALLGFGDAGMAGAAESLGAAFSGGGIGILQIGRTNWTLEIAVRRIKTTIGASQSVYEFGAGRTW